MKVCARLEQWAFTTAAPRFSIAIPTLSNSCQHRRRFTRSTNLLSVKREATRRVSQRGSSANLDHNVTSEEKAEYEQQLAKDTNRPIRTPWHRDGADTPPASRDDSASAMTKGKLLTTPSRLLKLILPLTTADFRSNGKDATPLALLMHPQQPLSYLERLIQAELPPLKDGDKERIPAINFSAEGSFDSDMDGGKHRSRDQKEADADPEAAVDHDHPEKAPSESDPASSSVETYSGDGQHGSNDEGKTFVQWSKSTEMGDFIRDAARGREFAVHIEGVPREIRVGVPSFGDRTHYLRLRLRKRSREIASMADVKRECDLIAHRSAQRVAMAGLGGLLGWSAIVAWLTFKTKLGWDVMEPVTYLVGLIGIIVGYGWFLWHNREVSYRSAMNLTVSTRQNQLYKSKGFDMGRWQMAIDDANALRREIISVANEYDVDWDEKKDTQYDSVIDALRKARHGKDKDKDKEDDKDDDNKSEEPPRERKKDREDD